MTPEQLKWHSEVACGSVRIIRASAPQRNNPGEHVSRKPAELWLVEGDKAYRLSHCKTAPAVPLEWLEVEG